MDVPARAMEPGALVELQNDAHALAVLGTKSPQSHQLMIVAGMPNKQPLYTCFEFLLRSGIVPWLLS